MTNEKTILSQKTQKCNFILICAILCFPFFLCIFNFFGTQIYIGSEYYLFGIILLLASTSIPLIFNENILLPKLDAKNSNPIFLTCIVSLLCFLIWAVISVFFATSTMLAIWDISGLYGRSEGLLMYFVYALIFYVTYSIKQEKQKQILLTLFSCLSLFICLFLLFDHFVFKYGEHAVEWAFSAPFVNPNHTGYFLTMAIIASASLFVFIDKSWLKILNIIAFFFTNFILVLNDTFGCEFAVVISLPLVFVFILIRDKKLWKEVCLLFLVFLSAIALGYTIQKNCLQATSTYFDNFKSFVKDIISVISNSAQGTSEKAISAGTNRWGLWLECFKNMKEHPLFGIGINCQRTVNPNLETSRPHNELLQFASTMGIPSAIFYLTALVCIAILTIKQLKKISPATFTCIFCAFSYFVSSIFGVSLPYTFSFYMIFLALALNGFNNRKKYKS